MLLCIGPSNQEVRTLPRMVKAWIDSAMGATPEARAQHRNALFLILTKFDTESRGEARPERGHRQPLVDLPQRPLLDFFGKEHDWPRSGRPAGRSTTRCGCANPNVAAKHILETDESGRRWASAPRGRAHRPPARRVPGQRGRPPPLRRPRRRLGCRAGAERWRHFPISPASWGRVCDPPSSAQVQARLSELRAAIRRRLAPSGIRAMPPPRRRSAGRPRARWPNSWSRWRRGRIPAGCSRP